MYPALAAHLGHHVSQPDLRGLLLFVGIVGMAAVLIVAVGSHREARRLRETRDRLRAAEDRLYGRGDR